MVVPMPGKPHKTLPPCPVCGMPQIESDIPVSEKLSAYGVVLDMLMKLKPGQSYFFDCQGRVGLIRKYQRNLYTQARRCGFDIITRRNERGIRVWRKN